MAPSDDNSVSSEDWSVAAGFDSIVHDGVTSIVTTCRSKGVSSESVWVQKTYGMVNEGTRIQPNVLSWSADGKEFEMKDVESLKKNLFPKYHGPTKFESFLRRLRRYGFKRVKTETITGGAVVVSFRHENFQRNRPDLLGNVTIISQQSEPVKSSDEKQKVSSALATLEKAQEEMKAAMKHLQNQSLEQKNRVDHLRREVISKDETIRRLEFRLERLENTILMANSFRLSSGSKSAAKSEPNTGLLPRLETFAGPSFALNEREISAVGLLPLLEEASPSYDEPTLPRSKRMKYSHKADAFNDGIERITLSRQSTPLFWGLTCL